MSVKESGSGNTDHRIRPVARIHTDFPTKFGIPRQSGLTGELESRIVFEPEFSNPDAVRGIEEFSHLWLIWEFSQAIRKEWSPTVRPPKLGGNTRVGVFATRSTFRPNPIGMSLVELKGVRCQKEQVILELGSLDLVDGTPVVDIKPYLPFAEALPNAHASYAQQAPQADQVYRRGRNAAFASGEALSASEGVYPRGAGAGSASGLP